MARWIVKLPQVRVAPQLGKLAVIAGLVAVGWCGHHTHWTIPFLHASPSASVELDNAAHPKVKANPAVERPQSLSPAPEFNPSEPLPAVEFASAEAARNCGIEIGTVESRAMDACVEANGVVDYDQTRLAQISVRVSGVVWRVEKRLGDIVRQGDVLLIVDSAEVGQAKAELLEACVTHRLKTLSLERLEKIHDVVAQRELFEARAASEVSRTQMCNAHQRLVSMGFPVRIEDITTLSTDELSARLRVLGLPDSVARETQSSNLIPLCAPLAGIVTRCELVRGELVVPSQPQYVIADTNRLWINLDVPQEDATNLKIGMPVEFSGEGNLREVTTSLTWIGTEVDPRTRTVKARAEGENPSIDPAESGHDARRLLQVGTFGTARILIVSNPTALAAPNEALHWQWEISREVVFVPSADGRVFTPRIVSKGLARNDFVQIVAGLKPGERVVTSGSRLLSSELSEQLQKRLNAPSDAARGFSRVIRGSPEAIEPN